MKPNEEVQDLVEQLQQAKEAYYGDAPLMSDAEFDALEDQLRDLDPDNAYFIGVGAKPTSGWKKVKHEAPMGSLKKAQTIYELGTWCEYIDADELIVSEKLDGISISLKYIGGKLVQAATRGDGETGEDITRNVLLMQGVPKKLDGEFSGFIRGEIVLTHSAHKKHVPEYKNLRNAAAGIAKRESDPSPCKHLTVMCYQAIPGVFERLFDNKAHEFEWLGEEGFKTPTWHPVRFKGAAEMYKYYISTMRAKLDYDIDGLVVELNDLQVMDDLGEQDGRPRGARALKFPHEQQPTKLNEIVWQVGNSGRVTPVAYFEPVKLAGATVSQASLHNIDNILNLWSCVYPGRGDKILVSRRNDVIPFVEKVISKNGGTSKWGQPPRDCPSCDTKLEREGAYLVCSGAQCPAQRAGAIKRWVKKLDIKEWGDALIDALCAEVDNLDIADLYYISEDYLSTMKVGGKVLGKSTAKKVYANLHAKKELGLADFVGAMGIDLWGQSMCQVLVDAGYDTLDEMRLAGISAIEQIPGVGFIKAKAFACGFKERIPLMTKILVAGVKIKEPVTDGCLSGKSFCFTGIRNKELEGRIKDAGGAIKTSVGKGLTYLVAKDPKSTSGKAKKAKEYGVSVVGIADVEKML